MSSLSEIYMKKETLEKMLQVLKAKQVPGIGITIAINDETKVFYGNKSNGEPFEILQNVAAYVSQTKEQREAKKDRFYVGNGKCFWTDGSIKVAAAETTAPSPAPSTDDVFPF